MMAFPRSTTPLSDTDTDDLLSGVEPLSVISSLHSTPVTSPPPGVIATSNRDTTGSKDAGSLSHYGFDGAGTKYSRSVPASPYRSDFMTDVSTRLVSSLNTSQEKIIRRTPNSGRESARAQQFPSPHDSRNASPFRDRTSTGRSSPERDRTPTPSGSASRASTVRPNSRNLGSESPPQRDSSPVSDVMESARNSARTSSVIKHNVGRKPTEMEQYRISSSVIGGKEFVSDQRKQSVVSDVISPAEEEIADTSKRMVEILPRTVNSKVTHPEIYQYKHIVPTLHRTKAIVEHNADKYSGGHITNSAVREMEQVRDHLQKMLKTSVRSAFQDSSMNPTDVADLLVNPPMNQSLNTSVASTLHDKSSYTDDGATQYDSALGLSSRLWAASSAHSATDTTSLFAENQVLRENMEKEKYRRKHCEKQIQQLQAKLLELQQQLAVAVATDTRKDLMIEQLDKTLAKVVEGWKKRDTDKQEMIEKIKKEKEEAVEISNKQRSVMMDFEQELALAVSDLSKEQQRAAQAEADKQSQLEQIQKERIDMVAALEAGREKIRRIEAERERLHEGTGHVQQQLQALQDTLDQERVTWSNRETEYNSQIHQMTEEHILALQKERAKADEEKEVVTDMKNVLVSVQKQLQQTAIDLDTAQREKENLKIEMGLMEARLENSKRKLEADLQSELEKELAKRFDESNAKMTKLESELRENHRKHVQEINQRHSADLEEQLQKHHEELRRKDDAYKQQVQIYDDSRSDMENEMGKLRAVNRKLEQHQLELTKKLQLMMQSHANEAMMLLVGGSGTSHRYTQAPTTPVRQVVGGSTGNIAATTYGATYTSPGRETSPDSVSMYSGLSGCYTQAHKTQLSHTTSSSALHPHVHPQPQVHPQVHPQVDRYLRSLPAEQPSVVKEVGERRGVAVGQAQPDHQQTRIDHSTKHQPTNQIPQKPLPQNSSMMSSSGYSSKQSSIQHNVTAPPSGQSKNYEPPSGQSRYHPALSVQFANHVATTEENTQNFKTQSEHSRMHAVSNGLFPSNQPPTGQTSIYEPPSGQSMNYVPNQEWRELVAKSQSTSQPQESANQPPTIYHERPVLQTLFGQEEGFHPLKSDDTMSNYEAYNERDVIMAATSNSNVISQFPDTNNLSRMSAQRESDTGHQLNDTLRSQQQHEVSDGYTSISEKFQEHEDKQHELQHYIKLLLDRSPGSPIAEPGGSTGLQVGGSTIGGPQRHQQPAQRDTSLQHTAEQDRFMNNLHKPQSLHGAPTVQQFKPQAFSRSSLPGHDTRHQTVNGIQRTNLPPKPIPPNLTVLESSSNGVLSPLQIGEISRLLSQYRGEEPHVDDLISYLKEVQMGNPCGGAADDENHSAPVRQNESFEDSKNVPKAKRNLSPQYRSRPQVANTKGPSRRDHSNDSFSSQGTDKSGSRKIGTGSKKLTDRKVTGKQAKKSGMPVWK